MNGIEYRGSLTLPRACTMWGDDLARALWFFTIV